MAKSTAIGIDLGTTNSCVGVHRNGNVHIIFNEFGTNITPSCVAFKNGERIVGNEAMQQALIEPENVVYDAKRLIGRRFNDDAVQKQLKHWPFTVLAENNKLMLKIPNENRTFCPEEISAMVLIKMKRIAEDFLGKKVKDAVITVPAYFNDSQRNATQQAGKIAGLNVLKLLAEPTAAALAYGLDKKSEKTRNIFVYDLGGGTFDVSLLTICGDNVEVKAVNGDTHLGGEDFDNRLVDYVISQFKKSNHSDPSPKEIRRLKRKCEEVKKKLSVFREAEIVLDVFGKNSEGFKYVITRSVFEEINNDLFLSTIKYVETTLNEAKMKKSEIDEIVVVGGSTRIPKIQSLLKEFFDGKNVNKSLNPDEAVAYGAAVQAAILKGDDSVCRNVQLVDVTAFSLGTEIFDGTFSVIIKKNSKIPAQETKPYCTIFDNQKAMAVSVYEGERQIAVDNNLLGEYTLENLPPGRAGTVTVDITYKLDDNGILHTGAVETLTGRKNQITIKYDRGQMTSEQVQRAIERAQEYQREDELKIAKLAAKANLEVYCHNVAHRINLSSASTNQKENILKKCSDITKWLEDTDLPDKNDSEKKLKELENLCKNISL